MKLNGDFYTVEHSLPASDGMVYGFDVRLNPDHFIFKAHFPGHPITPGVCLMQMIAELASMAEGCNLLVRNVKNAKYTGVVSPDEITGLRFIFTSRTETGDGGLKVQTLVTAADNPEVLYSKFSVTLVKEQF
ncbi:MAG: beta-hydroxyacyl-ACP dehydratase [Bacteroidaceae bacterium]|nr:beta-hydroxyacyl-ACP dehydratase [Bacteroidaceae bacterium]